MLDVYALSACPQKLQTLNAFVDNMLRFRSEFPCKGCGRESVEALTQGTMLSECTWTWIVSPVSKGFRVYGMFVVQRAQGLGFPPEALVSNTGLIPFQGHTRGPWSLRFSGLESGGLPHIPRFVQGGPVGAVGIRSVLCLSGA